MNINHIQYFQLAEPQAQAPTPKNVVEERINSFQVQLENHAWDTSEIVTSGVINTSHLTPVKATEFLQFPHSNSNANSIVNNEQFTNASALKYMVYGENLNTLQNGNSIRAIYQANEAPNLTTRPIGFLNAPIETMDVDTETSQLRRKMGVFMAEYKTAKDLEARYDADIKVIQDVNSGKYMMLTPDDVGYDDALSGDEALENMKNEIRNDDELTMQMFQDYFNAFNINFA